MTDYLKAAGKWAQRHRWDLAFVDDDWNYSFVRNLPKDRWFADPFILEVTDTEVLMLAEEFEYRLEKGRIALLCIDRASMALKSWKIVLELPTHLSFPAVYSSGKDVFICPENSASGASVLYRFDLSSSSMTEVRELLHDPLTDAVCFESDGHALMLSTRIPDPNGKCLGIYEADEHLGRYALVCENLFDDYVARNAGAVFVKDDSLVRPAQICDGGYGYGLGICFQKMSFKDGRLVFEELNRVYPPKGYDGLHTYNSYKGVAVVDCRRYLRPRLRSFLHQVKNMIKK